MATITVSNSELLALRDALETAVDIANDTCTEELFTNENVVSFDSLTRMRENTNTRITKLVELVKLYERVKMLSEMQ
jgi:hypothetical protein